MTSMSPLDLATDALDRFAAHDLDGGMDLMDDDLVYTNVGLPTLRGKRRVAGFWNVVGRWGQFDYIMLNAAADGDGVVLTERIDELTFGRLRIRFWVCGRMEIREGRIAVWRDYFDFLDCTKGFLRGLLALAVPQVLPPLHGAVRAG